MFRIKPFLVKDNERLLVITVITLTYCSYRRGWFKVDPALNLLYQSNPELVDVIREEYLFFPTLANATPRAYSILKGQFGQPIVIDALSGKTSINSRMNALFLPFCYRKKRKGFFIEAGAYNGVGLSNTLFLESKRNVTANAIKEEFKPINMRFFLSGQDCWWSQNLIPSRKWSTMGARQP